MQTTKVSAGTRTYSVLIVPGEDYYVVEVPALPGCFTQGKTRAQAIERAREAIQVHIAGLEADGEPVPEETERPSLELVQV